MENSDIQKLAEELKKGEKKEDPFISKNVWLNRIGLIILVAGMFPELLNLYSHEFYQIFRWCVYLAAATWIFKIIKSEIKSFWNS